MGLGKYSDEVMARDRNELVEKLMEFGISSHWYDVMPNLWKLQLNNSVSARSDRSSLINTSINVFYTPDPDYIYEKTFWKAPDFDMKEPWVLTNQAKYGEDSILESYDNMDDLIRKILELEYEESEEWNFLEIMEKIINFLKSK